MTGYFYLAAATLAFAVMGLTYKVADLRKCDRRQLNFFYFSTSTLLGIAWAASAVLPHFSAKASILGTSYGLVLFLTILAFRETASRGPISISWTLLNLSLVHLMIGKPSVHMPSLRVGIVTGVSSIIGLFTSIKAAAMLPAYIVFPVSSCGTIFLVALAGRFVFKEKIGPCGMAGIALGIAAIAFLAG